MYVNLYILFDIKAQALYTILRLIYIHIHKHIYIYIYVHMRTYTCIHIHIYIHIYYCKHLYAYMYVFIYNLVDNQSEVLHTILRVYANICVRAWCVQTYACVVQPYQYLHVYICRFIYIQCERVLLCTHLCKYSDALH